MIINPYLLHEEFRTREAASALCYAVGDAEGERFNIYLGAVESAISSGALHFVEQPLIDDPFEPFMQCRSNKEMIARNELLKWASEKGINLFANNQNTAPDCTNHLDPRKEKTLYLMIATLMTELRYDPENREVTGKLKRKLEMQGVKMSDKSIRNHVKEAFRVLNEKRE